MAKQVKKTVGALTILGWVFGLILILGSLGTLTFNWVLSIIYFSSGMMIFPPGYRLISKRLNIELSVMTRVTISLLILFVAGTLAVLVMFGFQS